MPDDKEENEYNSYSDTYNPDSYDDYIDGTKYDHDKSSDNDDDQDSELNNYTNIFFNLVHVTRATTVGVNGHQPESETEPEYKPEPEPKLELEPEPEPQN